MNEIVKIAGWFFLLTIALGVVGSMAAAIVRRLRRANAPQILGAELPRVDSGIDLSKRYDVVYGARHGAALEKLTGVRILGYLRSPRDETTGEYMDSRWLVAELPDGRRAYLRPTSVLWLLESGPG